MLTCGFCRLQNKSKQRTESCGELRDAVVTSFSLFSVSRRLVNKAFTPYSLTWLCDICAGSQLLLVWAYKNLRVEWQKQLQLPQDERLYLFTSNQSQLRVWLRQDVASHAVFGSAGVIYLNYKCNKTKCYRGQTHMRAQTHTHIQ